MRNFEVDVTVSRVPDCFSESFPCDATLTFDSSLFSGMHQCVQSYFIKRNSSETEERTNFSVSRGSRSV
ncbi:hypothetical protein ALC57_00057 [Trachymyrmex cornetzi]|uniref:Uncharacterized protein n=1 Tax=Trachymyrmex cornetzi TaxID=471704 RepID=A0A151K2R5_9HYME|nr:hypothetical protein ALC57_00057 [Trachymyrmex cornetzi]